MEITETDLENIHEKFITDQTIHIKKSEEAYEELKKFGWFTLMEQMMSDPKTVEKLMLAYDMDWIDYSNKPYNHAYYVWKEIEEKNRNGGPDTDPSLSPIAQSHMDRMRKARPLPSEKTRPLPSKKTRHLSPEIEDMTTECLRYDPLLSDLLAEPDDFPDDEIWSENWKDARNISVRPLKDEWVLLCGFYYPGIIIYKTGLWDDEQGWIIPDAKPKKTPFYIKYWKRIGAAPENIMKEV